jgi:hypothetical protein
MKLKVKRFHDSVLDAELMLRVLEGAIDAQLMPRRNSPCHKRLRRIIKDLGIKKPLPLKWK